MDFFDRMKTAFTRWANHPGVLASMVRPRFRVSGSRTNHKLGQSISGYLVFTLKAISEPGVLDGTSGHYRAQRS